MSIFKGFAAWVEKEFQKVYNEVPKIEKIADTTLAYVAPALQVVLSQLDPPAALAAAPIIAEVQKDLHVASGLVYDFGATPTAASVVSGVEKNLADLLAAGHITNPTLVTKVQKITDSVGSLAVALTAAVPASPAA